MPVYQWKHGWIPLTHAAALSKAKGNRKIADRIMASSAKLSISGDGIREAGDGRLVDIKSGAGFKPSPELAARLRSDGQRILAIEQQKVSIPSDVTSEMRDLLEEGNVAFVDGDGGPRIYKRNGTTRRSFRLERGSGVALMVERKGDVMPNGRIVTEDKVFVSAGGINSFPVRDVKPGEDALQVLRGVSANPRAAIDAENKRAAKQRRP